MFIESYRKPTSSGLIFEIVKIHGTMCGGEEVPEAESTENAVRQ
jgi:hypothetical protein